MASGNTPHRIGHARRGQVLVQFEDGIVHESTVCDLRELLDEPLYPERSKLPCFTERDYKPRPSTRRAGAVLGGDKSVASARGPLQQSMQHLRAVWRGLKDGASWTAEKNEEVEGLYTCRDFLSTKEVEALRLVQAAQHGWTLYHWGQLQYGQRRVSMHRLAEAMCGRERACAAARC